MNAPQPKNPQLVAALRQDAANGMTWQEAADARGEKLMRVIMLARLYGIRFVDEARRYRENVVFAVSDDAGDKRYVDRHSKQAMDELYRGRMYG